MKLVSFGGLLRQEMDQAYSTAPRAHMVWTALVDCFVPLYHNKIWSRYLRLF